MTLIRRPARPAIPWQVISDRWLHLCHKFKKAMALLCSNERIFLILFIVLLVGACTRLISVGTYIVALTVPAVVAVALLLSWIRSRCCASAVKGQPSDPAPSASIDLQIVTESHPLELNHEPAVHVIERHGDSCIHLQRWRPYTHAELIAATSHFDQSNLLGRGGQADVFRGVEIFDEGECSGPLRFGRNIAVKRFYFVSNNAKELQDANLQFKCEVQALSHASHRNVVEFYGYCIHGCERLLVSELMPNGSLHDFLFRPARDDAGHASTLDWGQRLTIAKDVARGLDYLHNDCNFNLVHLDIKPQNILLDEMLHAKIAEFGLAKLIGRDQTSLTGGGMVGGTPGYRAPELNCLVKGWERNITKKADVYSFGIVLLQLASGHRVTSSPTVDSTTPSFVMPGQTFHDAAFHLVKTQQIHLLIDRSLENSKVGQTMLEIGAMCIEMNPADRPDMCQVNELLHGISEEDVSPH